MYRHMKSIFGESLTGDGRSVLACPLACGHDVHDADVRDCLKRVHFNLWWHFYGNFMMKLRPFVPLIANLLLPYIRFSRDFHRDREYLTQTNAERQDLSRYGQWSVTVGLRAKANKRGDGEQTSEVVLRCPAPDCGYTWLANAHYRRRKQEHEESNYFLWFSPLKPSDDKESSVEWIDAKDVDPMASQVPTDISRAAARDGRRIVCAKCHCTFCGLCNLPWNVKRRGGWSTHTGKTCRRIATARGTTDADFAFVKEIAGTRSCPNCSMRVNRIDGCNHMICPCGTHWCYVCESPWNRSHYGCVDRPPDSQTYCTIS